MKIAVYIILLLLFCTSVFAFDTQRAMVDYHSSIVQIDTHTVQTLMANQGWLSLPFSVAKDGNYSITIGADQIHYVDMYIDGELYHQLQDIVFEPQTHPKFTFSIELQQGVHSIIIVSKSSLSIPTAWTFAITNATKADIDATHQWHSYDEYSQLLKVGDIFTGSYINVNSARDMALFTYQSAQYVSYYNSQGYVVVAKRNLNQTYFEKYFLPIEPGQVPRIQEKDYRLADGHFFISMQISHDGILHLAYGHHGGPLHYLQSVNPYDISQWQKESNIPGAPQKSVTYVRFLPTKDELFMMFRDSSNKTIGSMNTLLRYVPSSRSWDTVYSPLITDYGVSNPYHWRPVITPDGAIHLAWTWRLQKFLYDERPSQTFISGFKNKNIAYVWSPDGYQWYNSSNSLLELPITRRNQSTAQTIHEIDYGQDFFNHYGSDYDQFYLPHYTFTKKDTQGIAQQWHIYLDDQGTWHTHQVTNYQKPVVWTLPQQTGRAAMDVARPSMVVANTTALVLSRTKEHDNIVELYVSNKNDYSSWERIVLYNASVGGWEPQMDLARWHQDEQLQVLLAGITDKAVYDDVALDYSSSLRIQHKIGHLLKQLRLWRLYQIMKGVDSSKGIAQHTGHYSDIVDVEILDVDPQLENTGYILSFNYTKYERQNN